ncbi:MAG: LysM peptidoglycan-binding domain-containing protein [Verrucomicrobia bacterium]|nr:LysM peptidoglycan-binding domain-containing protein [Verrucomicrobiota bacterium]
MNTPNPLMPQGSLQQHQSRGKSTVRIAVFTIIAIHAVFFTGLLIQGCRPQTDKTAGKLTGTSTATNNEVARLNTNSDYYTSIRELPPSVTTNLPATTDTTPATSAPLAFTTTTLPPAVETPPQNKEYTIVRGDTLSKIAKDQHVTLVALNKANPGLEPNRLRVRQKILIPATAPSSSTTATGPGFTEPAASETSSNVHVVKAGETLHKIAQQHGTTVKAIQTANNMKTSRILIGKKLKLPAAQKPSSPAATGASAPGTLGTTLSTNTLTASPSGGLPLSPR